jgi:hypothetical protein
LGKKLKGKESEIHFLRKQAALSDPKAMYLLGQLEEKEGNIDSAFSWYMIAFCVEYLTYPDGVKKNEGLEKRLKSRKDGFGDKHKDFLDSFFGKLDELNLDKKNVRFKFSKDFTCLGLGIYFGLKNSGFYEKKIVEFYGRAF